MNNTANYKIDFILIENEYKKYRKKNLLANIILDDIPTKYYIRSDGTVYSRNFCEDGKLKKRKICKMKNKKDKDNPYYAVHLSVNNISYTILIHRLVALAFIPNPYNKPEVNHIDGIKSHNYISNLEWTTSKENMDHSYKTGLHKILYGDDKANSKITKKQAKEICRLLEENQLTIKEISQKINCSKSIIMNIRQRKSWIEVSEKYSIDVYDVNESTNGNKRIKKNIAIKICEDLSSGYYTIREIANKYNIPYSRVNDIKQHKTWKSISYLYDFSNYNKFNK